MGCACGGNTPTAHGYQIAWKGLDGQTKIVVYAISGDGYRAATAFVKAVNAKGFTASLVTTLFTNVPDGLPEEILPAHLALLES